MSVRVEQDVLAGVRVAQREDRRRDRPSTGGVEKKVQFQLSFNKGQLYFFSGVSAQPWQPYFDAWETYVGQWGRDGAYKLVGDIEAPKGISNAIP